MSKIRILAYALSVTIFSASITFFGCGLFATSPAPQASNQVLLDRVSKLMKDVQAATLIWSELRGKTSTVSGVCDSISKVCQTSVAQTHHDAGVDATVAPEQDMVHGACDLLAQCSGLYTSVVNLSVTIDRDYILVFNHLKNGDVVAAVNTFNEAMQLMSQFKDLIDRVEAAGRVFNKAVN